MITPEDLNDFCDLSDDEIAAIAECNAEPWVLSIARGEFLLCKEKGVATICRYFRKDIKQAQQRGDNQRVHTLKQAYHTFKRNHAA